MCDVPFSPLRCSRLKTSRDGSERSRTRSEARYTRQHLKSFDCIGILQEEIEDSPEVPNSVRQKVLKGWYGNHGLWMAVGCPQIRRAAFCLAKPHVINAKHPH